MASLGTSQSSNSRIPTSLVPKEPFIAIFVGATNGIGEATLKQFIKDCGKGVKVKAYFVGRNQDSGKRIIKECQGINSSAEVIFLRADVSLIEEVDKLSKEIKSRENTINLVVLTAGAAIFDQRSEC
jgi:short-subunit dehydrogenase